MVVKQEKKQTNRAHRQTFNLQMNSWINESVLKARQCNEIIEIIPDFLTMYGVFTSQSTSQVRQEMSNKHPSKTAA